MKVSRQMLESYILVHGQVKQTRECWNTTYLQQSNVKEHLVQMGEIPKHGSLIMPPVYMDQYYI